jgi:hypothetical protein
MAYEKINPIQQYNFQINRVLTYGEKAGNYDEIENMASDFTFQLFILSFPSYLIIVC